MATLKDVAEMSGVSVSTVSYVLNGKKTVRPETLKRIEDAIEQLDYYPNLLASSLKTNQSKIIGVVVSDMSNLFIVDVLLSIEEELAQQGYCMIVCNSNNDSKREKKCIRRLLSRSIDGMILIGTGANDFSVLKNVTIPLVCVDRNSGNDFYIIQSDNTLGGKIGTEYLLSKGYRRILFLGNQEYQFSKERYQGYENAMKAAGRESDIFHVDLHTLRADEAYEVVDAMIKDGVRFDAVYGCIDYFAIGALNALLHNHVSVPKQVGVLGNDDIAPAKFMTPSLSSVAQKKAEIGKQATQVLLKLLNHELLEEKQFFMEPHLVLRESC